MDDNWIKRKFLKAMMPYHKAMSSVIRQRPDFHTLSSSEVLDEFVAMSVGLRVPQTLERFEL